MSQNVGAVYNAVNDNIPRQDIDMAYHHGNLRAELLARAEQVLADSGVESLSLRSLARDLEVSHSAPGRHFADRQTLLDALAIEGFRRLHDALTTADTPHAPFEARTLAVSRAYVTFACDHAALLDVMYARKHGHSDDVQNASDRCAAVLLDLFADVSGAIDDAERFGVLLLAALHGIAGLASSGSLPPGHDPGDVVVDLVRRLIGSTTRPHPTE